MASTASVPIAMRKTPSDTIRSSRGFTIVELLVSIAIFSLITSFGVSVFVRALRAQRSVVSLISANDNASLAIEAIAREIRRGRDFSMLAFGSELRFFNAEQREVRYRFDADQQAIVRNEDGTGFFRVTADNVVVTRARFEVQNTDSSGNIILPRVSMSIRLGAPDRDVNEFFTDLHTTVGSRGLNNPLPPAN